MGSGANGDQAVLEEYASLAPAYDDRWSFYVWATLSETLKRMALRDSDRVLDVGCGTSSLFEMISAKYPSAGLVGVDLCAEMLGVARKKMNRHASHFAARANGLPFRSGSFDVVVSCNAFHYFHEPEECLAEFARVLRPGGRLIITDWCDDYISCRACDLFLRLTNRAHFKMYGCEELRRITQSAGFENVRIDSFKINWLWGLMTVQAKVNSAN